MRYIKLFEELHKYRVYPKPEVDDWVLALDCNFRNELGEHEEWINNYIRRNLGQVVRHEHRDTHDYIVRYWGDDEMIEKFGSGFGWNKINPNDKSCEVELKKEEMTWWSDNKEEMQHEADIILQAKKYNL